MLSLCARSLYGQVYGNTVTYGVASGRALARRNALGTTDRFRAYSTGVPVAPAFQRRSANPMAYDNRARGGSPVGMAHAWRPGQVPNKRLVSVIRPQKLGQRLDAAMRTPPNTAGTSTVRNLALPGNRFGRINMPKFGLADKRRAYGGGLGKAGVFGDRFKSGLPAKSTLLSGLPGGSLLNKNQLTSGRSLLTNPKSILNRQTGLSGKTSFLTGQRSLLKQ